jgi:glycosyltransferase involved in cell wall biosynthesis
VIIPTAGRPELLAQALASVRAIEGPDIAIDAIVVDDGNDPMTAEIVRRHGARLHRAPAHGAGAARNEGLRAATGDFIAFLDDDDVWLPGHVRPHVQLMHERAETGAVMGQVISYDHTLREHSQPWPNPLPTSPTSFGRVFSYQPQIGATVVRASVVQRVGLFDETLVSDEDWDWQLRLALATTVDFVAVACVAYRSRPEGLRQADELNWSRLPDFGRVFWRNVRRGGRARPSWPSILRGYLRVRGQFASGFINSAVVHSRSGDISYARRQLLRGLRASPVHSCLRLMRESTARRAVLRLMAGASR